MSDGGKGDNQRPTDHKAFAENFDKIFQSKPKGGSFVWCKEKETFVPKSDYYKQPESAVPFIQGDIQPYQSMVTGEMITSRSQHREHLIKHNCFEIGNEVNHMMKIARPEIKVDREAIRRNLADVMHSKGY